MLARLGGQSAVVVQLSRRPYPFAREEVLLAGCVGGTLLIYKADLA